MGIAIGPADWWVASPEAVDIMAISCPVGTVLPDKSALIARDGGCAWIVAPATTQVGSAWAGGQYNSSAVGDKCCISEWSGLETALTNAGLTPSDWFVPSRIQLQNPGYLCRTNWDSFSVANYWSSTQVNASAAYNVSYFCCTAYGRNKATVLCVRAFRCVTY